MFRHRHVSQVSFNSRLMTVTLTSFFLFTLCSVQLVAADWPHWRGPQHNGISDETTWSADWSAGPPRTIWEAALGIGFASVAVSEGRLVTAGHADGIDTIWCLNAASGEVLWMHRYACPIWDRQHEGGPGTTPAIAEGRVYTLSREGDLFCFDVQTGAILWQMNTRKRYDVSPRPSKPQKDYGYTGSPLVLGRLLIVPVGGKNANTVAFDRKSGKVVWVSGNEAGTTGAGYGTPTAFSWRGEEYLAIFSLKELEVLELETGRRRALFPWPTSYGINAVTPCIEDNRIYVTSDFGSGLVGLEFDGTALRELFRRNDVQCKFTNPILRGGHLYTTTTAGVFKCIDTQTGDLRWQHRGFSNASLLLAGDRFLCLGERGDLLAAEMTSDGYKEIARTQVLAGRCWTPPVLANGLLYVRNAAGQLRALDLTSPGSSQQQKVGAGD